MRFTVSGKPRGQGRPRTTIIAGRPHIFKDRKSKAYEAEVRRAFTEAGGSALTGPVVLKITAVYPISTSTSKKKREEMLHGEVTPVVRPDLDNVLKAVQDALNGFAYHDDSQIVSIEAEKVYAETGSVTVEVTGKEGDP